MRAPCLLTLWAIVSLASAPAARAGEQAGAAVPVRASFAPRSALTVSTRLLHFDIGSTGDPAVAVVEFAARVRTARDGEIVLSVERPRAIAGPGGAADVDSSLQFRGEGAATLAGDLDRFAPVVAGRWRGSGDRRGRLVFTLRAASPGRYSVPLEFVLSTP